MFEYFFLCAVLLAVVVCFVMALRLSFFKTLHRERLFWQQQWQGLSEKQQQRASLLERGVINAQENRLLEQSLVHEYLLRPIAPTPSLTMEKQNTETVQHDTSASTYFSMLLLLLLFLVLFAYGFSQRNEQALGWHQDIQATMPKVESFLSGDDTVLSEEAFAKLNVLLFMQTLQVYLQRNNFDLEAWTVFGNLLQALELEKQALMAYRSAYRMVASTSYKGSEPKEKYTLNYANARLSSQGGQLDEESYRLLNEILRDNPRHPNALMLLGMAAYHSGEYRLAENAWSSLLERLQETVGVPEEVLSSLQKSIETARQKVSENAVYTAESVFLDRPLSISLYLDEKLSADITDGLVLFVFLRAADAQGMPLAAVRTTLSKNQPFPLQLQMGRDHVLAGQSLRHHENFQLSARISFSGQAMAQAGDIESQVIYLQADKQLESVKLMLDQRRQR